MLRRAFAVSAASGSAQRRPLTAQPGGAGGECLRPRDDIDLRRQRAMVDAELREGRERWLAAQVSPVAQSLDYHRHALRLLIINAAQHQQQRRSDDSRDVPVIESAGSSSSSVEPGQESDQSLPPFDLTRGDNLKSLLNDIDIVIRLAADRNAQMQQRMLSSTIDQIAKLDLWSA